MLLPDFVVDRLIRRKAALHALPLDRYQVRIARTCEEYGDAFRLLHVAFVYQGYESIKGIELRITPQHVLPESTVLVAYEGEALVGTMTVTLDSPAGLMLDKDYQDALDALRDEGEVLVEFGSLAIVKRCVGTGVSALMNMAASRLAFGLSDATCLVMGVAPRAEPVYRALFGFRPLGPPRHHAELETHTQGLKVRWSDGERHLRRYFDRPMADGEPVARRFLEEPPVCVEMPPPECLPHLTRWKLSREVFQEVFVRESGRIDSLDPATRAYLAEMRTAATLRSGRSAPLEEPEELA